MKEKKKEKEYSNLLNVVIIAVLTMTFITSCATTASTYRGSIGREKALEYGTDILNSVNYIYQVTKDKK